MKAITKLLFIFLATAFLMAGCTGSSDAITVTSDQNNNKIEVKKGDIIDIKLSANPSTGYSWEFENLDTKILEQVGEIEHVQEKSDQPVVGAPETAVIRIKAVGSGETAVKLIYHRSWETGVEPTETFLVNVVVK